MALRYRADIDGLRALAVLAVILFHTFPNELPGGFVGVDVFFVISGYLITQIILEDLDSGSFTAASFYARRVRRIFPALIVVLIATFAFGWHYFLPMELASLGKNILASALFSANLMLLSEVGYFDVAAHLKPLLHLWSLGIEEQFYLVWPLLLWSLPRKRLLLATGVILSASFTLNIAMIADHPSETFYLPFTRAWELMAGAVLAQTSRKDERHRDLFAAVGIAAIALSLFFDKHKDAVPRMGGGCSSCRDSFSYSIRRQFSKSSRAVQSCGRQRWRHQLSALPLALAVAGVCGTAQIQAAYRSRTRTGNCTYVFLGLANIQIR